ncbi:MAG: hypothetical protein U0V87_04575 [Acidobacteriota bacterium]
MTLDVQTARKYLLGDLAEDERETLEARYFGDDEALAELVAFEDSLIDDYLDDRLQPADRERMERHYLSIPVHRTRLAVARELQHRTRDRRGIVTRAARPLRWPRSRQVQAALAAAILIGVVSIGAAIRRFSATVDTNTSIATSTRPDAGTVPFDSPQGQPRDEGQEPRRSVIALALPALSLRSGGGIPTVERGNEPADVELVLELATATPDGPYAVTVRTVEDAITWTGRAGLPERDGVGRLVRVRIPLESLPVDDYVLLLAPEDASTRTPAQRFSFRVRDGLAGVRSR